MNIVEHLNNTIWCKLAPSNIHGIGVFALRDIPARTAILVDTINREGINLSDDEFKQLALEIQNLLLDIRVFNEAIGFISPNADIDYILFMNNSDNPNFDAISGFTLRDIQKGEEITENYNVYSLGKLNREHFKSFLHD
jgi:SET domain-containing protein